MKKVGWEDLGFIVVVCATIATLYWSLVKSQCTVHLPTSVPCVETEHWLALGKPRTVFSGMAEGFLPSEF